MDLGKDDSAGLYFYDSGGIQKLCKQLVVRTRLTSGADIIAQISLVMHSYTGTPLYKNSCSGRLSIDNFSSLAFSISLSKIGARGLILSPTRELATQTMKFTKEVRADNCFFLST